MIKKVLYCLCIYLIAMFLVSFLSNIFEPTVPKNKKVISYFLGTNDSITEQANIQQKKITEQQDKDDLSNNKFKTTKSNPFSIDVNIIYPSNIIENRKPDVYKCFIADIPRCDVFEELEKRKSKVIYKRKFCLCFMKQQIKRLKAKKMAIRRIYYAFDYSLC